jgi:hypothetical protein
VLDGRNASRCRKGKRDFAFAGVVKCRRCGCAMVGEIKKQRSIYSHCTGWKGKCPDAYVREEVIAAQFSEVLGCLQAFQREIARGRVTSWVPRERTQETDWVAEDAVTCGPVLSSHC